MKNYIIKIISALLCAMLVLTSFSFVIASEEKTSITEDEFNLTCDYKTIKGENVRVYNEGNGRYSYIHLEEGSYCKFIDLKEETAEVNVFTKGSIQKAWIPAASLTTTTTIIVDSSGAEKHVSELDPDYEKIISSNKVISKAGKYNPLTKDGARATSVENLLKNSKDYKYDGIELETPSSDSKDSKDSNKTDKNTKTNKTTKKEKTKSFKANLKATITDKDGAKLYKEPSINAEELIIIPENIQIDVESTGVAWSYVSHEGKNGYVAIIKWN